MFDSIPLHGIVTIHKIPDEWRDEDFKYYLERLNALYRMYRATLN